MSIPGLTLRHDVHPEDYRASASPQARESYTSVESELLLADGGVKLRRELTLVDALSIMVGGIVGSGIFTSPGVVLVYTGSVGEGLLSWILAGVLALLSSLLFAELGASIPLAGGAGAYFKVAFGGAWSFSFVWAMFFAIVPGSLNLISLSFAQYFIAGVFPSDGTGEVDEEARYKYTAILCLVIVTGFNCAGVRVVAIVQNVLGLCKVALVGLLIVVGIVSLTRDTSVLEGNMSKLFKGSSLIGFGPSMVAALWAYCGWGDVVFLAEELKDPGRDIPRSCFGGIAIVAITYLLVNMSYLAVLPSTDIQGSIVVAMDAASAVLGPVAGQWTAILVGLSLLGTLNAQVMYCGRYLYGAARSGEAHSWLGHVSERTGAPTTALLIQGFWCVLLLLMFSDFLEVLSYFGTASFTIYGLSSVAQMKIRHKLADLHRPYTVPFHPFASILVIAVCIYLVVSAVASDPLHSAFSFAFISLSFPVYHLYVKEPASSSEDINTNSPLPT